MKTNQTETPLNAADLETLENDAVWSLLDKTSAQDASPAAKPMFARNVMREIRQLEETQQPWWKSIFSSNVAKVLIPAGVTAACVIAFTDFSSSTSATSTTAENADFTPEEFAQFSDYLANSEVDAFAEEMLAIENEDPIFMSADEIYNLGAQSHVAVSFEAPEYTADVDALGALRILEAIRFLDLEKKTRFYQASTSELYGEVQEIPQKETTPFHPRSPYAVAKMYAYWITVNYRESYGMYACNGILFNHESPRRGETFVTRKITRALSNISQGLEKCLFLGNMDALRDWGHAKDYVRMQWMMLQQDVADDFVIATGKQISVREFVTLSAKELGITLRFEGEGIEEKGFVESISGDLCPGVKKGDVIVQVDPKYFRPAEVETLLGDPTKAKEKLGWVPEITVEEMCAEMVQNDLAKAKQHALLKAHGFDVSVALGG